MPLSISYVTFIEGNCYKLSNKTVMYEKNTDLDEYVQLKN